MNKFAAKIEVLEHHWMRAWMQRDRKLMKTLAARDFIFLLGSTKPVILDRPSWLEAATTRFVCKSYTFGEAYVRRHGSLAVIAVPATIEAGADDLAWSGEAWLVALWRRSTVSRQWKLVECTLSRPDTGETLPPAMRAMQLWR